MQCRSGLFYKGYVTKKWKIGKALWLERGMEVWKEESEGTMGGEVKEWGKERERKREGGEKGTGCVAHLLLMSCESFANCLQVATKSGILSRS